MSTHPLQGSLKDSRCHFSPPISPLKPVSLTGEETDTRERMLSTLRPVPQHRWNWDLRPCGSPHAVGGVFVCEWRRGRLGLRPLPPSVVGVGYFGCMCV